MINILMTIIALLLTINVITVRTIHIYKEQNNELKKKIDYLTCGTQRRGNSSE